MSKQGGFLAKPVQVVKPGPPAAPEVTPGQATLARDMGNGRLPSSLRNALSQPPHQVVDRLTELIDADSEILISLYSATFEQTGDLDEQVKVLLGYLEELGFVKQGYPSPSSSCDFLSVTDSLESQESTLGSYSTACDEVVHEGKRSRTSLDNDESARDMVSCPVCLDSYEVHNMFEFMCKSDQELKGNPHLLCYGCAREHVLVMLRHGNPNLKCFVPDCKHLLFHQEIAKILGEGDVVRGQQDPHFDQVDVLKRDQAISKIPAQFAKCPGCNWIVARSVEGAIEKATCPTCDIGFCTNCAELYHYRTTCRERRKLQDKWRDWIIFGRAHYWRQDKAMEKNARAVAAAERRRVETVREIEAKDEQYKAAHCRHCPHCDRVVEKLEGCSLMRCGYDTDTQGNVQNGCKEKFDWNEARKYEPVNIGQNVRYETPPDPQKQRHKGWLCDWCHKEIVGLRFECVNCPSFALCERCEGSKASEHNQEHLFMIHEKA